ncbi:MULTISPECIES: GntR family transcriptional regulator [Serratia]|uniref:GntR family transcriptional regulator n=1 Tax=Serratia TaxID=613 RepID=UPI000BB3D1C5|nr:GntR family transcriptional regulator [Serratia oryzae]
MSKKPIYRQIADTLRQQIANGELKPGDALPTEALLREQYGVSRVTVRQALKLLTEERVIESLQGSGWYVKEERVNYDIYQLTSFYEKLADRNVETHSDVLIFQVTQASPAIAEALRLTTDDKVYYVKRVRYIKQKPVTLEETWMPLALFPDLSYEVMQKSKYHYIEQVKKLVIDRSEQEIIPVMPSEDAVKALGIDAQKPVLEKVSTGFLSDGTVFEFSRNVFKSEDYRFTLVAKRGR